LLKALEAEKEQSQVTEIVEYDNNIVPFLSQFSIVPGDHLVNKKLLYKLYKANVEEPVSAILFYKTVGLFLQDHRDAYNTFFKINLDQFKIAEFLFDVRKKVKYRRTTSPAYRRHFEAFLENKGIKKGDHWIEGFMLYAMYKEYRKHNNAVSLFGYKGFIQFLRLYFKYKRNGRSKGLVFAVDKSTHEYYTEEQKNELREAGRSAKSAETKKQSKRRQASVTKTK